MNYQQSEKTKATYIQRYAKLAEEGKISTNPKIVFKSNALIDYSFFK